MKLDRITIFSILSLLLVCLISIFYFLGGKYKEFFENGKYTAVIIEPRQHKALSFVLNNFLENLSDEWNILILHGNKNIDFVNNIIQTDLIRYKKRISTINLNVDDLTINDYNKLLLSKSFYDYIPTETFLIFQTDTIICKKNKLLIEDFLKYDYVGAPWSTKIVSGGGVGNGGLSLRKKSKMIEHLDKCEISIINEDAIFSNSCIQLNKPDSEEAKKFSVETIFNENSFGVHKPWPYLPKDNINVMKNNCEDLDKLIELNKD